VKFVSAKTRLSRFEPITFFFSDELAETKVT